ncbi:putative phosphoglycerate mutase [Desulfohalotomaculum tongense]|uniref:alpha-ribazole phosphatase n=1 Tax=Desulforadius tongensis TaxID=1216062 RepID=UPI0019592597|nr:putative phosphoglycerate mutase [Desulforadius tongensis]
MEQRLIYLVRHGEVDTIGKKRFIGQIDLPLSDKGISQAKRLQQELSCAQISGIYCSDLQRAVKTAEIIAEKHRAAVTVCQELREIKLGRWEGKTFEEVCRHYPQQFKKRGEDIANYRPPDGESFADLSKRVVAAFHKLISNSKGNILIVGHAGVNRMILCHLLGMPLKNLFNIYQDYGCLNIILYGRFGFRLRLMNKVYSTLPR